MTFVPETANRKDWPRLVSKAVNRLLSRDNWADYPDFADDTAAAAGGVGVGERYRTGSTMKVRIS